jgi:hypothetical protein
MLESRETPAYAEWFVALRDRTARAHKTRVPKTRVPKTRIHKTRIHKTRIFVSPKTLPEILRQIP